MGLFGSLFGMKRKPLTEEEKRRLEEEEKEYREAVRKLKDRALLLRSHVREITEDNIFDELTKEQFVRYAKIVGEEEEILGVVPGHYTNAAFSFDRAVHVLFLNHRMLIVGDEWESKPSFFSFLYEDIGKARKKRGIFESSVRFAAAKGLAEGKESFVPDDGWDGLVFYRKLEYTGFIHCFQKQLPGVAWE